MPPCRGEASCRHGPTCRLSPPGSLEFMVNQQSISEVELEKLHSVGFRIRDHGITVWVQILALPLEAM